MVASVTVRSAHWVEQLRAELASRHTHTHTHTHTLNSVRSYSRSKGSAGYQYTHTHTHTHTHTQRAELISRQGQRGLHVAQIRTLWSELGTEEEWAKGKVASGEEEESFDDIIKAGNEEEIKVTPKNLEILRTRVSKLEEEKAFRIGEQVSLIYIYIYVYIHTYIHTFIHNHTYPLFFIYVHNHTHNHTHTQSHTHRGVYLGCCAPCGIAHEFRLKRRRPSRAPTNW